MVLSEARKGEIALFLIKYLSTKGALPPFGPLFREIGVKKTAEEAGIEEEELLVFLMNIAEECPRPMTGEIALEILKWVEGDEATDR